MSRHELILIHSLVCLGLGACADDTAGPDRSAAPSYATAGGSVTSTELGFGSGSRATAINDQGRIAGRRVSSGGAFSAFVWIPAVTRGTAGTGVNLQSLGSESFAAGINATGHVVGMRQATSVGVRRAVLWSPAGSAGYGMPLDLGTAAGLDGGFAWAVSDFRNGVAEVVGSTDFTLVEQALVWTVTLSGGAPSIAPPEVLGGLVAGQGSSARATNGGGTIVGYANRPAGSSFQNHAVLWTRTGSSWTIVDLLPGSAQSIAWGVNAAGYVVGEDGTRGFVRTPAGAVQTLPSLRGATAAYAINDAGEISGYSSSARGGRRLQAVLWLPQGTGYVLKTLGSAGFGYALNEPSGGTTQTAGSAPSKGGSERAVLWTVR
jgi:uncharacterized membrane protein